MISASGPEAASARIDLAETADFDLGGLRVSPARREVFLDNSRRELEPKVAQVLVALAAVRPQVVSRERLIEQCWDGRIVGDDALNRCILALRHLAKGFSPEPFTIETVSRVGYCLIERHAETIAAEPGGSGPRRKIAVAALLGVVIVFAALGLGWSRYGVAEAAPASIAVLPFRNLSEGSPFFAQGIAEEILGQLAREPQFRVAGSSSSSQLGKAADIREVARKLGVEYVVDGSVRSQGNRVRVNAALLKASNGRRMWTDSFDGKLDDILAIQQQIGSSVAGALKRKLVDPAPAGGHKINGQAYALYLTGRGMVRTGNPDSGHEAVGLLHESVRIDPGFAPAWSSLAQAILLEGTTKGDEGLIAVVPEARAATRQALTLDPNLADAHGKYAELIGSDTIQGMAQLRRAAELDKRSGETLLWKAMAQHASGDFTGALASYQRALDLDPLWPIPMRAMMDLKAGWGERPGAEAIVNHSFPDDAMLRSFALGRIAWTNGDYSEAARRFTMVSKGSSRWSSPARLSLEDLRYSLGISEEPPSRPRRAALFYGRYNPRVRMSGAPSAYEWKLRNRSGAAELVYRDQNELAAKLMLSSGRSKELLAAYDGPVGLLGMHPGDPAALCRLLDVPTLALALRSAGRGEEADGLLDRSDALIRSIYKHGRVPAWFDDDAAGVWAMQGKTALALDALERTQRRGWMHAGPTDLKLAEEPAFRPLHGLPRFEALLSRLDSHWAREKTDIARQQI